MVTRSGKYGCTVGHSLCLETQLVLSENNGILDCIAVLFFLGVYSYNANVCVYRGRCRCLSFVFHAIAEGLVSVLTVVLQQSVCPFPQSFDVTMSCCDNEPHAPPKGEHHAVCLGLCQSSGATLIHASATQTQLYV